jgi:hypothetical protein
MTEREYLNATNLAKVRAAMSVLSVAMADTAEQQRLYAAAMTALCAWTDILETVVKTTPESQPATHVHRWEHARCECGAWIEGSQDSGAG